MFKCSLYWALEDIWMIIYSIDTFNVVDCILYMYYIPTISTVCLDVGGYSFKENGLRYGLNQCQVNKKRVSVRGGCMP